MINQAQRFAQRLMGARLVVSDLDYTLVAVREAHIVGCMNGTQRKLGLPEMPHDAAMRVWNEYYREDQLRQLTGFSGSAKEFYDHFWTVDGPDLRRHQTDAYPGAGEVLRILIASGVRVHILTGTSTDVAHAQAEVLGVPNLPILALGGNPRFPDKNKPHPAGLEEVMDHHGSRPLETVMVGDTAGDAETAVRAGTHFLYYNSRNHACDLTARADAIISDWRLLLPYLEGYASTRRSA